MQSAGDVRRLAPLRLIWVRLRPRAMPLAVVDFAFPTRAVGLPICPFAGFIAAAVVLLVELPPVFVIQFCDPMPHGLAVVVTIDLVHRVRWR